MTPKKRSIELIEKFRVIVAESDLHWPDYLPGDSEIEYAKEELSLATASAIQAVVEIQEAIRVFYNGPEWSLQESGGWKYWNAVLEELKKM